jgi:hypothetical protein
LKDLREVHADLLKDLREVHAEEVQSDSNRYFQVIDSIMAAPEPPIAVEDPPSILQATKRKFVKAIRPAHSMDIGSPDDEEANEPAVKIRRY